MTATYLLYYTNNTKQLLILAYYFHDLLIDFLEY